MKIMKLGRCIARFARASARASLVGGVAVLAGGMVFVGPAHAGTELVVNGSFEDNNGFNGDNSGKGWTTVAGTDASLGFDVYSHSTQVYYDGATPVDAGEWYFHTVGLGSLNDTPVVVSQTIDVSASVGSPYLFSAYIAGFNADTGDTAQLQLQFLDAADGPIGDATLLDGLTGGADGVTNTWDLFSAGGTIPVDAESAVIDILQASISANGNDNYVDLVSLQIVPEPSTWGLMGAGLAAYGIARRRRH